MAEAVSVPSVQSAPTPQPTQPGSGEVRLPVCRCADTRHHHHIDCRALEVFDHLQSALAAARQKIAELGDLLDRCRPYLQVHTPMNPLIDDITIALANPPQDRKEQT